MNKLFQVAFESAATILLTLLLLASIILSFTDVFDFV